MKNILDWKGVSENRLELTVSDVQSLGSRLADVNYVYDFIEEF